MCTEEKQNVVSSGFLFSSFCFSFPFTVRLVSQSRVYVEDILAQSFWIASLVRHELKEF